MIQYVLSSFAQANLQLNTTEITNSLQSEVVNKLLDTIQPFIIPSAVLSMLVLIMILANSIRKWRVQSSVIKIHKDVVVIKEKLLSIGNSAAGNKINENSDVISSYEAKN